MKTFALFSSILLFCMMELNSQSIKLIDKMGIEVSKTSREFSFTNKRFGQYYGETNSQFTNGWQGWTLKEQKVFNDYGIRLNGELIKREKALTTVFPHKLTRKYSEGYEETLFFPDDIDGVFISIKNLPGSFSFVLSGLAGSEHEPGNDIVSVEIDDILSGSTLFIQSSRNIKSSSFSGRELKLDFSEGSDEVLILVCIESSIKRVEEIFDNYFHLLTQKEERIELLLQQCNVETNDDEFNIAFLWSVASIDALVTEQEMKGIFAGLPWFNNYWGRDTFISLPGATFVIGNFSDAREILLSFAKEQDTIESSKYFGRIPNRVTLSEKIYNTTDGTPWFVIQSYNYFKYSGDAEFIKIIYPAIKLALEGALKNYVDDFGFLTHEDAETWMDAKGPKGAWSPRDNRANDIQALWYLQLKSTSEIASYLKDEATYEQAKGIMNKIESNFPNLFIDPEQIIIYDRLHPDGTGDKSIRPNLFFPLNVPELIPSFKTRIEILANAMQQIVYPYGVLSLSFNDDNFHPYHEYQPYYVKDAAYHNGIIWTWNTGPVVQNLCEFGLQEKAWILTSELTSQILTRGAVGTLSELTDALPHPGSSDVKLSGTFTQAWSLAEYVRNVYQDYLGVKPDAPNNTLYLLPALPERIAKVKFKQKVGENLLKVEYNFGNDFYEVLITPEKLGSSLDIAVSLINKANANYLLKTDIEKGENLIIKIPVNSTIKEELEVIRNGKIVDVSSQIYIDPVENQELYRKVNFATPYLRPGLKSLKGPDYYLLKHEEIKRVSNKAKTLIFKKDEVKDEFYQYPANKNFADGILDLREFVLKEDDVNYYFELKFRNLVNPGWHIEYGYQLTLTSICIQNNSNEKLNKKVGANSNYNLPEEFAFNTQILVGGGFEIKNAYDVTVATYIPKETDVSNSLGNVADRSISFSIPKHFLGEIKSDSRIAVLVGAQDDHGGAGIGEFREVSSEPTEWTGGGKSDPAEHNVYDWLFIK